MTAVQSVAAKMMEADDGSLLRKRTTIFNSLTKKDEFLSAAYFDTNFHPAKTAMERCMRLWLRNTYIEIAIREDKKKNAEPYKYEKWIIKENNKWKMYWDLYCMLLVVYVALVVPYRLGFGLDDTRGLAIFGNVMDFSFLIDVILTFF